MGLRSVQDPHGGDSRRLKVVFSAVGPGKLFPLSGCSSQLFQLGVVWIKVEVAPKADLVVSENAL